MNSFYRFQKKYLIKEVLELRNHVSNQVDVSVVVTTYNQIKYISKCLDSILDQRTNFSFEIIIGEDDSNDGTREICKSYAQKYPKKIRLLQHSRSNNIKINGGPSGRFNMLYSLSQARGKYVAICEGDDYWIDREKLQLQFEAMENRPDCSLCFHSHFEENRNERKLVRKFSEMSVLGTKTAILGGGGLMASNTMFFRRSYLNDFPELLERAPIGDGPLVVFLSTSGGLLYLDKPMSVYRIFAENSWSKSMGSFKKRWKYFLSVMKMWTEIDHYLDGKFSIYIRIKKLKTLLNLMLGRF
jgi:glycosyltransferase involved in cell wall biosynthesis